MSKKWNVINNVITLAVTIGLIMLSATLNKRPYNGDMAVYLLLFALGALAFGVINTFAHELGHLITGKIKGFAFVSMTVWFFHWRKENGKIKFGFNLLGGEAGYTEMVSKSQDNLGLRYKKMTLGGINASLVMTILSVLPLVFVNSLSVGTYAFLAMSLPVSAYFLLGSLLPMISEGVKNDGAVALSFHRKEDSALVAENVMKFHSELYNGKNPKEVGAKLLFEVPQLAEDDLNFITLLSARYVYYVDNNELDKAKEVSDRLCELTEYLPKYMKNAILAESLYITCVLEKEEEKAEELLYELDKYINNVNSAENLRIKLAYLIEILGETEGLDMFFDKAEREAQKMALKGLCEFERRQVALLKEKLPEKSESELEEETESE